DLSLILAAVDRHLAQQTLSTCLEGIDSQTFNAGEKSEAYAAIAEAQARLGLAAESLVWVRALGLPRDKAWALLGVSQGLLPLPERKLANHAANLEKINVPMLLGRLTEDREPHRSRLRYRCRTWDRSRI